jgi:hypothetical protein
MKTKTPANHALFGVRGSVTTTRSWALPILNSGLPFDIVNFGILNANKNQNLISQTASHSSPVIVAENIASTPTSSAPKLPSARDHPGIRVHRPSQPLAS